MKYLLAFFLCFTILNASSQTSNDIGKAIFESLKNEDTLCFKYFSTDSVYFKLWLKDSSNLDKDSWGEIAKRFKFTSYATTEVKPWKWLAAKMKGVCQKLWTEKLINRKTCDNYKISEEGFEVVKESQDSFGQKYLLIVNAKEKFAIKFSVVIENEVFYLTAINPNTYYKDDDGEFSCTISCVDGKERFRICDAKQF